jgi:tRNA 2-thiouridine synthesizing protein A
MTRHYLDARGLRCPLPVLRAQKMLKTLAAGDVLAVEATDPGAPKDFAAFCDAAGFHLLESDESDGVFRFAIARKE